MDIKILDNGNYLLEIGGKEFSIKELVLYAEIMKNKKLIPEQFKEIENQWNETIEKYNKGELGQEQKQFIENIKKYAKEKGIDEIVYFGMINLNNFLVNKVEKKLENQEIKKKIEEGKLVVADIFDIAENLQILLTGVEVQLAIPILKNEAEKIQTNLKFF